jgi:hypothetical protein
MAACRNLEQNGKGGVGREAWATAAPRGWQGDRGVRTVRSGALAPDYAQEVGRAWQGYRNLRGARVKAVLTINDRSVAAVPK